MRAPADQEVRADHGADLVERSVVLADMRPVGVDGGRHLGKIIDDERHTGGAARGQEHPP